MSGREYMYYLTPCTRLIIHSTVNNSLYAPPPPPPPRVIVLYLEENITSVSIIR